MSLLELSKDEGTKKYFKRVTQKFVKRVHEFSDQKYSTVYDALMKMITPQQQEPFYDEYFKKIVQSNINLGSKTTTQQQQQNYIFPGPLATQMGRRHLETIQQNDYYITEKSDGTRCMILSMHNYTFPRWHFLRTLPPNTQQQQHITVKEVFSLLDNCGIECAVQYCVDSMLKEKKSSFTLQRPLRLERNNYHLELKINPDFHASSPSMHSNPLLDPQFNERYLVFLTRIEESNPEAPHFPFRILRSRGWSFTYIFDRNYEFYLCMEEFVFPTADIINKDMQHLPLRFQTIVLLDGEIIYNLLEKRYNFSVYDIVSYSERARDGNNVVVVSCLHRDMSARIHTIRQAIVESHHAYYKKFNCMHQKPQFLQLVSKHFYPKKDLMVLMSFIRPDPNNPHVYSYKGYNRNDGLIFTPNSVQLYSFKPGSCSHLLKWKYSERLTSDFMAEYIGETSNSLNFKFYFHYRGDSSFYRNVALDREVFVKEHGEVEFIPGQSYILECLFHVDKQYLRELSMQQTNVIPLVLQSGKWEIYHIRKDKNSANGFKTIANTVENIMEDITVEDLKQICTQNEPLNTDFNYTELESEYLNIARDNNLFVHYCTYQPKGQPIQLSFSVRDNGETRWAKYLNLDECIGPNNETGRALENWLSQNTTFGTKNSAYLQCLYLPRHGRWKILNASGEESKATASNLLLNVEKMTCITLYLRVKESLQQNGNEIEDRTEEQQQQESPVTNDNGSPSSTGSVGYPNYSSSYSSSYVPAYQQSYSYGYSVGGIQYGVTNEEEEEEEQGNGDGGDETPTKKRKM